MGRPRAADQFRSKRSANLSVQDRWTLSRDRNTLRIRRQIITLQGETESNMVYQREGAIVSEAPANKPALKQ